MGSFIIRKAYIKTHAQPFPTIWGKTTKEVVLWRGISFVQCDKGSGFIIDRPTAKRYLSKDARKIGIEHDKKLYFEGTHAWAIICLEMMVLMYRLSKVTGGTPISKEQLTEIAKEGYPQYFN